ncbi:hypothetical protein BJV78DRAFT_1153492 [Lactifluus subvellereus]|nr:hypothetical protein BJV78DRAFT_1153492 [Lactifluus subvellereus]
MHARVRGNSTGLSWSDQGGRVRQIEVLKLRDGGGVAKVGAEEMTVSEIKEEEREEETRRESRDEALMRRDPKGEREKKREADHAETFREQGESGENNNVGRWVTRETEGEMDQSSILVVSNHAGRDKEGELGCMGQMVMACMGSSETSMFK